MESWLANAVVSGQSISSGDRERASHYFALALVDLEIDPEDLESVGKRHDLGSEHFTQ